MKTVSVLTPWYNGITFVDRYMEMILAQTYPKIELIFVDDASTDGVMERAQRYGPRLKERGYSFRCIHQAHAGQAAALNRMLALFTGEYFTSVDSDDILTPDSIERRVAFLEANPAYGFVTSKGWEADESDLARRRDVYWMQTREELQLFEQIVKRRISTFALPYLFRTEAFLEVNPQRRIYVNEKVTIQDVQLVLPMAYRYLCGFIDAYLFTYVIRQSSGCHEFLSYLHKLHFYDGVEEIWLQTYNEIDMPEEKRTQYASVTKRIYQCYRNTMLLHYLLDKNASVWTKQSIFCRQSLWIFGAGDVGERLYGVLTAHEVKVAGFLDNSRQKQRDGFCGLPVESPENWMKLPEKAVVFVAGAFHNAQMQKQLEELGLHEKRDFYVYPSQAFLEITGIFKF